MEEGREGDGGRMEGRTEGEREKERERNRIKGLKCSKSELLLTGEYIQ